MFQKTNILKEIRLTICWWCLSLVLWITPKDDPEGLIIIESIHNLTLQNFQNLEEQENVVVFLNMEQSLKYKRRI